jgi:hypothetical protein
LSMDEWPEDLEKTRNLDVVNFVLTVIFILEMCLKVRPCERISSRRTLTAARACSTLTAARACSTLTAARSCSSSRWASAATGPSAGTSWTGGCLFLQTLTLFIVDGWAPSASSPSASWPFCDYLPTNQPTTQPTTQPTNQPTNHPPNHPPALGWW